MQIHLAKSDITTMNVDAVVNPANSLGIMGGGVAAALSRKGGPSIQRFYVLQALDSGLRILVPVDKADQVGLRRVAREDEIEEVLDILRDKEIHVDRQTWNRRYRGFMEKIKSGSLFEVAEVFRDLYRLKGLKPLSFGERRMLDTAKGLIVQELAVARAADSEKVEQELESIFR